MAKLPAIPAALVGAVLLGACTGATASPASTLPASAPDAAVPTAGRPVSFQTSDGLLLEGVFYEPDTSRSVAVVLAHMFPADQDSWKSTAIRLSENGFLALTFNFRGYGDSQGPLDIALLDRDVEAALDFVLSRGPTQATLVGASMGGTASVIVAARRSGDVAGVVSLSSPRSFRGLDASVAIQDVTVPVLFIASKGDSGALDAARWFAGNASGLTAVQVFEGSAHGTDLLEGQAQEIVETLILDFITDPEAAASMLTGDG